jgi:outer membrane protein assembly factor BamA
MHSQHKRKYLKLPCDACATPAISLTCCSTSPKKLFPSAASCDIPSIQMLSPIVRPALVVLCLLIPTLRTSAQSFQLPPISFTGVPALSQADLLKVSGLHPGATATQTDIQAAAQHLSDTGLFADIRFESNSTGLVFALNPIPAENSLPASFTNFVWWSPAELKSALVARVPLYTGIVPLNGNLQNAIIAALKAMVAEKGVTANIVTIAQSDHPGATPTSIAFAIESPPIRVQSLTLVRASPTMQTRLEKVIKDQTGQPFETNITRQTIASELTTAYHDNGYLDMAVVSISQAPPQVTPAGVGLAMTATINEGPPYSLFLLTWPGSDVISSADFNKQVKMKPGDVASEAALRQSLSIIANAYFLKGFQDAKIQAPPTFDHLGHHVSYTIAVVPGPQYRIHAIKTVGLSDAQQKQFSSAWGMNSGDIYDATYVNSFLVKNTSLTTLAGYSASYKALADPDSHLVDLTITFAKGGTLVNAQ